MVIIQTLTHYKYVSFFTIHEGQIIVLSAIRWVEHPHFSM